MQESRVDISTTREPCHVRDPRSRPQIAVSIVQMPRPPNELDLLRRSINMASLRFLTFPAVLLASLTLIADEARRAAACNAAEVRPLELRGCSPSTCSITSVRVSILRLMQRRLTRHVARGRVILPSLRKGVLDVGHSDLPLRWRRA